MRRGQLRSANAVALGTRMVIHRWPRRKPKRSPAVPTMATRRATSWSRSGAPVRPLRSPEAAEPADGPPRRRAASHNSSRSIGAYVKAGPSAPSRAGSVTAGELITVDFDAAAYGPAPPWGGDAMAGIAGVGREASAAFAASRPATASGSSGFNFSAAS
jgi:hypothetical protein